MPSDCDDGSRCTIDTCESSACKHVNNAGAAPDDGEVCTTDACLNGEERHTATPGNPCGENDMLTCNTQGQCSGCTMPEQCGAVEVCRAWICNAQMVCEIEPARMGFPVPDPTAGNCMAMACDGIGNAEPVNDNTDLPPDDGLDCTDNACTDGTPNHPLSMVGTVCAEPTTYCNAEGACVPCTTTVGCQAGEICFNEAECVSCTDGELNGNETGTDCGGPIAPNATGQHAPPWLSARAASALTVSAAVRAVVTRAFPATSLERVGPAR